MKFVPRIAAAVLVMLPGAALAHIGHSDAGGFIHGFMHPVGGFDHVLAMVAVGLYAAMIGGRGARASVAAGSRGGAALSVGALRS